MQNFKSSAKRTILRLIRKTPRERAIRSELGNKSQLSWWCVYGSTRSGTTYISRLAKSCAKLWTGDWRLGEFLVGIEAWREVRALPAHEHIEFDYSRLLRDVSRNIMDNAYSGDGSQIDFVYKQAALRPKEFKTLVAMWGPPERLIFCLREPAGFIASASKKFPRRTVENLQQHYVMCLNQYAQIGGDIVEYNPDLSLDDYIDFLQPLDFTKVELPSFRFKGEQEQENTTQEMWDAYHKIKAIADRG